MFSFGQKGRKSLHLSTRDGKVSLVIKVGKGLIGQKGIKCSHWSKGRKRFHWSKRDGKFSLVNKGWKVFIGQ